MKLLSFKTVCGCFRLGGETPPPPRLGKAGSALLQGIICFLLCFVLLSLVFDFPFPLTLVRRRSEHLLHFHGRANIGLAPPVPDDLVVLCMFRL